MNTKPKTLGIIGFGKEGQAIFQHYKTQYDQVYIFDEKIKDLDLVLSRLDKNCSYLGAGNEVDWGSVADEVKLSEPLDPPQRIFRLSWRGFVRETRTHLSLAQDDGQGLVIIFFNHLIIPYEVDFLVKSPGIATHKVQLQNPNLKIQSLISLLFEKLDMSKVIAVTGTKGKSTVSSLIFHILKATGKKVEILGNIGNINVNLLDNYDPETYYIFELSSFQCQQLTHSPHIAIWTNFFIDHQDVHQDMDEYYQAKANICRFQTSQDFFITISELENVGTAGKKIIIESKSLKDELNYEAKNSPLRRGVSVADGVVAMSRNLINYKNLPYNPKLKQKAKELRKAGNLSEVLLWNEIKNQKLLRLDFDRQKIIGNYIVDFYSSNLGLIIEIDGESHDFKGKYDIEREKYLLSLGLEVIHFRDIEIKKSLAEVLESLYKFVDSKLKDTTPSASLPPLRRGEFHTKPVLFLKSNYIDLRFFQTKLLGQHNQINCQFAFEACKLLEIDEAQILEAIATFDPIKGRLEKVNEAVKDGKLIEFYTDDLATIPEATWQAILAFEGRVETLITGGYDKGSDYTELANNLANSNIKNIIYFNPTGSLIVSKLDPIKVNIHEAESMNEAVQLAFKLTNQGVCLLSCASASFGMFINAYDRGEQYRECIIQAKTKQP
jgi:UDP-N-acetylmuramoylalanine-D-glutamate ligase